MNLSSWYGHRLGDRRGPARAGYPARAGFTLVELLVALTILSAGVAIVWSTFSATLTAWRRGDEFLADLRRHEFAADEIAAALRSIYHRADPEGRYGFVVETGGDPDETTLRWISLGGPDVPESGLPRGVTRRLTLGIESDAEGTRRAVLRAGLAFMPPDEEEPDPVARMWPEVVGLRCRIWNPDERKWENEWKTTNAVPRAVELTIVAAGRPNAPPIEVRRWVELPTWAAARVRAPVEARPADGAQQLEPSVRGRRGRRGPRPPGKDVPEP